MEKNVLKIFLDVDDFVNYHGLSKSWCYERLRAVHKHFGLKPHQRVNTWQFCEYERIDLEQFVRIMQLRRELTNSKVA